MSSLLIATAAEGLVALGVFLMLFFYMGLIG
jgi:hypothetical protein